MEGRIPGVFRPKRTVAGEEVCVQVPPADGEWGGLCVASELAGVPPGVHCACLCVAATDPSADNAFTSAGRDGMVSIWETVR